MSKDNPLLDVFNPLAKKNLGISVADALLAADIVPLVDLSKFRGVGVYALYYSGKFGAYRRLVTANKTRAGNEIPIYVGKAVPSGARKGLVTESAVESSTALHNRLCEHRASIDEVQSLAVADFLCRFLGVDDIWIPLGESMLIERFHPLWNVCIDGFGIKDPGKGRYDQKRSVWDTLHPGRTIAQPLKAGKHDARTIQTMIKEHFDNYL